MLNQNHLQKTKTKTLKVYLSMKLKNILLKLKNLHNCYKFELVKLWLIISKHPYLIPLLIATILMVMVNTDPAKCEPYIPEHIRESQTLWEQMNSTPEPVRTVMTRAYRYDCYADGTGVITTEKEAIVYYGNPVKDYPAGTKVFINHRDGFTEVIRPINETTITYPNGDIVKGNYDTNVFEKIYTAPTEDTSSSYSSNTDNSSYNSDNDSVRSYEPNQSVSDSESNQSVTSEDSMQLEEMPNYKYYNMDPSEILFDFKAILHGSPSEIVQASLTYMKDLIPEELLPQNKVELQDKHSELNVYTDQFSLHVLDHNIEETETLVHFQAALNTYNLACIIKTEELQTLEMIYYDTFDKLAELYLA